MAQESNCWTWFYNFPSTLAPFPGQFPQKYALLFFFKIKINPKQKLHSHRHTCGREEQNRLSTALRRKPPYKHLPESRQGGYLLPSNLISLTHPPTPLHRLEEFPRAPFRHPLARLGVPSPQRTPISAKTSALCLEAPLLPSARRSSPVRSADSSVRFSFPLDGTVRTCPFQRSEKGRRRSGEWKAQGEPQTGGRGQTAEPTARPDWARRGWPEARRGEGRLASALRSQLRSFSPSPQPRPAFLLFQPSCRKLCKARFPAALAKLYKAENWKEVGSGGGED